MPIADHLWYESREGLLRRAARAALLRERCLARLEGSSRDRRRQLLARAIHLVDLQLEATLLLRGGPQADGEG